ncbi:c-type cytochrome [Candidatus Entotheonella palauensis]|uniref:c-type cytochrome n=1 Tax=Candidatus Entotheonella palauensis TaxID=93172 RepID=UPI000B7DFE2F|nr:c-type cytochrome [Candidatus Entotheonella palauensis]
MRWPAIAMVIVIGALLTPFLMVAGTANAASHGKAASRGHSYYKQYCSTCHGPDGRGGGPRARMLAPPPADLTRIAQRRGGYFPERQIIAYIDGRTSIRGYHKQEMPVWGRTLTGTKTRRGDQARAEKIMSDLMQYLKTIQQVGGN